MRLGCALFVFCRFEEQQMKQTENQDFRKEFYSFYRRAANLSLYLQNAGKPDVLRIAAEIKSLSNRLDELIKTPPPKPEDFLP
jgi:hypothetical protein